jgi:hypothetical protein
VTIGLSRPVLHHGDIVVCAIADIIIVVVIVVTIDGV